MHSKYLSSLTDQQKDDLRRKLWEIQEHKCFICEKEINLTIHKDVIDIDHIKPLKLGGKDEENNFALTHSSQHLATDFEKIKYAWRDYKVGKIGKLGLIKEGLQVIGKKFVNKIIGNIL